MSIEIEKEQVPLGKDADGVIRVSGTRVTLDSLISAFQEGATAEDISLLNERFGPAGYLPLKGKRISCPRTG